MSSDTVDKYKKLITNNMLVINFGCVVVVG